MGWFLAVTLAWVGLSLVVGLLIGGAAAWAERTTDRNSGLLREGSLDGEREPRALQVHEQGLPIV